ncbi:hypothetical protein [Variovorax ginsengisoli]|uniref:Uncharacterized protein n=1 Tax=Variovorax ginsengisoli TaxID=363844 RepID=A0ABT8SDJ6_9BURK|nr:hypothetical protein [Variovorax ginsengisoli]MDN8617826.1 hypothetical protein [Variovorax ginsengisoli]MDO1536996.1 hypothetical protein [Variovorax ginsengisoli]
MSTLSKRDAMHLVTRIRGANLAGHAIAARTGHGDPSPGFLGGLESILQHFLRQQGCPEAAEALVQAMNEMPTEAEIKAHNDEVAAMRARFLGVAS